MDNKEQESPKVVINIGTAYNVNPAATKVENNFYMGNAKEARTAVQEALGRNSVVDTKPIRKDILEYVSRVRPLLTEDAKSTFMRMWEDILNLPEVVEKAYDAGKQWGTNFNRDLVANILYYLRKRKIYALVYRDNNNGAALAEALEQDKDHSVKHALRNDPPKDIQEAINNLLEKKY